MAEKDRLALHSQLYKEVMGLDRPVRTVTEAYFHEVVVRTANEVFMRQEELPLSLWERIKEHWKGTIVG